MIPLFVCVLKSGGSYCEKQVAALAAGIRRYNPGARIVCFTDFPCLGLDVERVPLKHALKGWFSKLEIFSFDEPRFLYLDLDTVITGRVDIDLPKGLFVLKDFDVGKVNSSVMYINGNYQSILEKFLQDPLRYTKEYSVPEKWGDQDFIRDYGEISGFIQDLVPGLAKSWKRDLDYRLGRIESPPPVLVFHGKPKPEDLNIRFNGDGSIDIFSFKYIHKFLFKRFKKMIFS